MSRRLILMRHGHAQPEGPRWEDFERPLSTRGRQQAEQVGRALCTQGMLPDLLLVSAARRTRETAGIVAESGGIDAGRICLVAELYQASAATIWAHIERLAGDPARVETVSCLLVCAHNPGLSDLASRLGPVPGPRDLSTAGTVTACWNETDWADMEPRKAQDCRLIAP